MFTSDLLTSSFRRLPIRHETYHTQGLVYHLSFTFFKYFLLLFVRQFVVLRQMELVFDIYHPCVFNIYLAVLLNYEIDNYLTLYMITGSNLWIFEV